MLPAPPPDLAGRKLPVKRIGGPLYRIHKTDLDCLYFGRLKSERFDDPQGLYGVLYAALQPEAAFAEVFLRNLSLMVVSEEDLTLRALWEIGCSKPLECVDLCGEGLRKMSCDNRISTEKPYDTVGLWSRAIHSHPQHPDAILYRSRHNPRRKCLALFDRCQGNLSLTKSEGLLESECRRWTVAQLKAYNLFLEPL